MSSGAITKYVLISLAICIYLFCSLTYLELPGLYYDEVLFANAAMGDVDGTFIEWRASIGGKTIPLMLMRYIGAVKAYLYAPIFALWGTSIASVRLPAVVIGLVTLFFTYALVRATLGEKVALTALLLLASDPTFIFANKIDWGPVALMMLLKMSSLYLLWRWLNGGRLALLALASFLLGLGVYDKIIFLWFVAALAFALPLCFWRELKARLSWPAIAVALTFFLLGCLPLIAYNLKFDWLTFKDRKVINTSLIQEIWHRNYLLRVTLNGNAVYGYFHNEDFSHFSDTLAHRTGERLDALISALAGLVPILGTLMPQAVILAIGAILILWIFERLEPRNIVLFFLSLFVLINVFVYATAEATGPHHMVTAYPFHHILIAFAISRLAQMVSGVPLKRAYGLARLAGVASVSILLLTQLVIDARYLKGLKAKGGVGIWSDAIYDLARYAEQHSDKTFVLMDWGFSNQLLVLSQGLIKKEEGFVAVQTAQDEESKIIAIYPHLIRTGAILVFHAPGYESFPMLDIFKRALERYSLEGRVIKTFYQRDGQPVYLLYEVTRPDVEAYLKSGRFLYQREGEQWDVKSGGDIDYKGGASQAMALGSFWGAEASHFVVYRFTLPREISVAYLYLRYAFENPEPQRYYLFLDDNLIEIIKLESSGGFGYVPEQWKLSKVKIGAIGPGTHELKIKPAADRQVINIDYFYLCEGDCDLKL